ncbi:uncharacterized protein LOC105683227 [Athalia rosae]|uniref:uncharacterized protein LOC105683227 n=1 Tax=Athalia rosae TaxID=37344 RepID=UPI002034939F|nr:uncharacterized protein LOC105683227 [Athalia rosae]
MAVRLPILLLVAAACFAVSSARVFPAEPLSVVLDAYGNPVLFLREKRAPLRAPVQIPQRAMMFTGYYRPTRRSNDGDQATGVFAQGNSVSGGSYLGGARAPHLINGPQPIEEPELSSAQAEAAPQPEDGQRGSWAEEQEDRINYGQEEGHPHETPAADPEPVSNYDVDAPAAPTEDEGDRSPVPEEPTVLTKPPPAKNGKKVPGFVAPPDDDEEEDEPEEDQESYVPLRPAKGNRRQNGYTPSHNNFFPMMFSFPGLSRRASGSSGLPSGVVTAIANSYSTGKGGVASSVATAYGGTPTGKKARRVPVAED